MSSQYEKLLVPQSHIKSPGALFRFHSESFISHSQASLPQDLLVSFKSSSVSSIDFTQNDKIPLSSMNLDKLKTEQEEISNVLFYANEMLSRYGIDLKVENCKQSKEIYNMLAVIIPEVCLFPADFFSQIQLKQFIICGSPIRSTPIESSRFSIELVQSVSDDKVSQRLYQIIWNQIIKTNPEITNRWTQLETEDDTEIPGETFSSLEDVFVELMSSPNHGCLNPLFTRMRSTLQSFYPKAMPDELFERLTNDKDKSCSFYFSL